MYHVLWTVFSFFKIHSYKLYIFYIGKNFPLSYLGWSIVSLKFIYDFHLWIFVGDIPYPILSLHSILNQSPNQDSATYVYVVLTSDVYRNATLLILKLPIYTVEHLYEKFIGTYKIADAKNYWWYVYSTRIVSAYYFFLLKNHSVHFTV